mgnify:CR=1 FL=1
MRTKTEVRKSSHIKTSLQRRVEARESAGFNDVFMVHRALPEIDKKEIEISTNLFNHELHAPIIIGPMTGGTAESQRINLALAEAAERLRLGIGVGSQRAALENRRLVYTYRIVREKAPNALVFANIGCPQLVKGKAVETALAAIDMIDADALYIHLNPLQESVQVEGETCFQGVLAMIQEVVKAVKVPVVVKETGAGISSDVAKVLTDVGVSGIDVSGAGGTSWAGVEYHRAKQASDRLRARLGETFWEWGIPTVASLIEVALSTPVTVVSSGGVRSGLDIAKSLALGASATSLALPLLRPATLGSNEVERTIKTVIEELRTAMFLTGAKTILGLRSVPVVVTGSIREWLSQRGFDTGVFAKRPSF